ncbi:MAG: 2-oxo acid dehydrogenase subunit E2 [Anaerolineae bacterium]|nr:2-oxo acid dehydrogenase subunit E2 [Anaerolineae bacterium]MCO5188802.1 2-oxo acid dehydrogenase subunit E2 [Anaerolineae bacterium]
MAEFIKMPTLGFDMEEGTLGVWLKDVGDEVKKGDVLAEIESDKVTQELQARHDGILLARIGEPGDALLVGANLGIIGEAGEDISAMEAELAGGASAPKAAAAPVADEEASGSAESTPVQPIAAATAVSAEFPDGVKATPVARRLARDNNVDLTAIGGGSGPGGRIRKSDVETYLTAPKTAAAPAASAVSYTPSSVPTGPETEEISISRLRKAIARRMTESKQTIPQFYVTSAVDMTDALALRKQINDSLPDGEKVTVNDLIVKACGLALRQYPNLNSSWGGDKVIRNNRVNVSTAVAVEGGLLTVTQKNTDITPLVAVARQNREMIARARSGKVQPEDVSGSTFSTSNLGASDVDTFIAIISPPEAGILAIGSAVPTMVFRDGEPVVRSIMKVTCSADHRVTDGAEVAEFLKAVKANLEQPIRLLL